MELIHKESFKKQVVSISVSSNNSNNLPYISVLYTGDNKPEALPGTLNGWAVISTSVSEIKAQ